MRGNRYSCFDWETSNYGSVSIDGVTMRLTNHNHGFADGIRPSPKTVQKTLAPKFDATLVMASVDIQQQGGHATSFEPLNAVQDGHNKRAGKHDVETTLNYYLDDGQPPKPAYVGKPESYERPTYPAKVTVHDIRGEEDQYNLDNKGFLIYPHVSKEKDFVDDEKIKAEYYPEVEQLIKDA